MFRIFVLGFLPGLWCSPLQERTSEPTDAGFIGKGTNELATAFLQGSAERNDNVAYSPFGYSAILAIFSEGAGGASKKEIAAALHFPENQMTVRHAYRDILETYVKKNMNAPEFKNWFYIYKNYTINEELQNVLRKYYLTEVRYVERPEEYVLGTKKAPVPNSNDSGKKTIMEMSQETKEKVVTKYNAADGGSDMKETNMAEGDQMKSETPMEHINKIESTEKMDKIEVTEKIEKKKNSEKKENAEKMKNSEKMKNFEKVKKEDDKMKLDEADTKDIKIVSKIDDRVKGNESEAPTVPVKEKEMKKGDLDEKMPESKKEMVKPAKKKDESGLRPIEHLSGMTDSTIKIKGKESKTQMIIFNGLYYKGEWESAFEKKPADDSRTFYKSDSEKIFVSTIHSQGLFNMGNIANLDCKAIELPYKGNRYSLLILVPNTRNGLTKLISDLSGYPLSGIYDQLTEKLVDVCLPSFEINTISKPVSTLKKLGKSKVTNIFDPETADLSGISTSDSGLYVEEVVQMVTFKVDAENSRTNFLTASIASSRSNVQPFQVNQPFLFYLRDNRENVIIVNGKVVDPTPKPAFYFS